MQKFDRVPGLRSSHGRPSAPAALLSVLSASAALIPLAAGADNPAGEDVTIGPLQEVVVTATRRDENISKVPISITALTEDAMDLRGVKDVLDVVRFTPGVAIDNSGTNNITIRGIGSTGGAGTTGIYLDDTPIQMRALAFNPDDALPQTFDLERVEVLRGPQGTLFGAGSEGGTVRYITTQPSLTKTSVYSRSEVSYTQGGDPSYEAGVAVGTPVIDGTLGIRVSVWYRRDGGYIDRIDPVTSATSQTNANYDTNKLVRLAAVWAPSDALTVTPSIYYQDRYRNDVESYWPLYSDPGHDRYRNADPDQIPDPDKFYLTALKIEGNLGFASLISNTSYYHRKETTGYEGTLYNLGFYQSGVFLNYNPDGTVAGSAVTPGLYPLVDANGIHLPPGATNYHSPATIDNGQQNFTQELRLQSNDPTSRLIWTTGAFFSVSRQTYLEQIHDPLLNELSVAATGLPYGNFFTDYTTGLPVPYDPRFPNDSYFLQTRAKDQQFALYGEGSYAFTDQLKLTLGARYSWTKYSFDTLTGGPQLFLSPQAQSNGESEGAFTPRVSLGYQADPKDLYYFTYAKGFRPGGGNNPVPQAACSQDFSNLGISAAPSTFKSDSVNSFELGAKNNIDNRIKLASSIYYIHWNNIQQTVLPPICQITFISNLGAAVAKGADIQADFAVTDRFTVELTSGYTEARYTKDSRLTPAENPPVVSRGDAIIGESSEPPAQPAAPFTASLGLEYKFSLFERASFIRVDDEYEGRPKWLPPTQDPKSQQYDPAFYTLPVTNFASARAGMTFGGWQTQVFCDNLADAHPVTNYNWTINPGDGSSRLQRDGTFRPRTIGLTFLYRYH